MKIPFLILAGALLPALLSGAGREVLRHEKVVATEIVLAPGESLPPGEADGLLVWLQGGTLEAHAPIARPERGMVVHGHSGLTWKNTGSASVRLVVVRFLTAGRPDLTWSTAGLAPNHRLLFENQYARVTEIRIPPGDPELRHTHHGRVVVCLSSAELEHPLPDGRTEKSHLRTDEVAWRDAVTHTGRNVGPTPFWAVVIEPK